MATESVNKSQQLANTLTMDQKFKALTSDQKSRHHGIVKNRAEDTKYINYNETVNRKLFNFKQKVRLNSNESNDDKQLGKAHLGR